MKRFGAPLVGAVLLAGTALANCPPPVVWSLTLNGTSRYAQEAGVAFDGGGGVAVAGEQWLTDSGPQVWWVEKFTSGGAVAWSRSADSPAIPWLQANAVAVAGGDTLAAGYGNGSDGTGDNWLVERYDGTGAIKWSLTWNDAADNGSDRALGLATDAAGDAYVAGFASAGARAVLVLMKLDPTGQIVWTRTWPGDPALYSKGNAVAVDASGSVYVAGLVSTAPLPASFDGVVLKYDPAGGLVWSLTWTGTTADAVATGVAADASGSVYVTGNDGYGASLQRWKTMKIGQAGDLIWSRTFIGSAVGANGLPGGIAVGFAAPNQRVYVQGTADSNVGAGISWALVGYDAATGADSSSTEYDGYYSYGTGVAADASGRVVGAGWWQFGPGPAAGMVIKYQDVASCLDAAVVSSTGLQYTGGLVTVTLTVTNNGTGGVTSLAPALAVGPGAAAFTAVAAPSPAGPLPLAAGAHASFVWTFTVTGAVNPAAFTASVTGTDAVTGAAVTAGAAAGLVTQRAAAFQLTLTHTPTAGPFVPGQLLAWYLTVTNTGDIGASGVTTWMEVTNAPPLTAGLFYTGGMTGLAGQSFATYGYSTTITGAGTIAYTITVTGFDAGLSRTITAYQYGTLAATQGAVLQIDPSVDVGSGATTETILVHVKVTNAGTTTATQVTGSVWRIQPQDNQTFPFGGGGGAWTTGSVTLTRSDTSAVTLAPGASHDFVLTYAVTGHGTLSFGGIGTGRDTAGWPVPIGIYAYSAGLVSGTFSTLTSALTSNLPPVGKAQVRNGIIRNGSTAYLVLHGATGGGTVDAFLYSRAGLPLGRLGTAAIMLDGDGVAVVPFDGTLDGKSLTTGMYWIVTAGAVKDRQRVMVVHDR